MRSVSLYLMAVFYFVGGILHFVKPGYYLQIMPSWIPASAHLPLVYLSGAAESGLGAALVVPRLRRLAAWGIIALLIAIFPANVHMWLHDVHPDGVQLPSWFHAVRLPMQAVLIAWAYWHTRPPRAAR